jgi:hypothetical protein
MKRLNVVYLFYGEDIISLNEIIIDTTVKICIIRGAIIHSLLIIYINSRPRGI